MKAARGIIRFSGVVWMGFFANLYFSGASTRALVGMVGVGVLLALLGIAATDEAVINGWLSAQSETGIVVVAETDQAAAPSRCGRAEQVLERFKDVPSQDPQRFMRDVRGPEEGEA